MVHHHNSMRTSDEDEISLKQDHEPSTGVSVTSSTEVLDKDELDGGSGSIPTADFAKKMSISDD